MRDPELLYGPKIGSSEHKSNILLFNGLKGDARSTWISGENEKSSWYQKLSAGLGGASIYSFDIPQDIVRSTEDDEVTLEQNARDVLNLIARHKFLNTKTLLVGYSFGGILLKAVLSDMLSRDPKHFRRRLRNIAGIVFLGVPHKGSQWANAGLKFFKFLRLTTPSGMLSSLAGTSHLEDVQKDSRVLKLVGDRFSAARTERFGDVPVVSVVEQHRIALETILSKRAPDLHRWLLRFPEWLRHAIVKQELNRLIVDLDSAILKIETETVLPANTCHMGLPWFEYDGAEMILDIITNIFRARMISNPEGELDYVMLTRGIAA